MAPQPIHTHQQEEELFLSSSSGGSCSDGCVFSPLWDSPPSGTLPVKTDRSANAAKGSTTRRESEPANSSHPRNEELGWLSSNAGTTAPATRSRLATANTGHASRGFPSRKTGGESAGKVVDDERPGAGREEMQSRSQPCEVPNGRSCQDFLFLTSWATSHKWGMRDDEGCEKRLALGQTCQPPAAASSVR